MKLLKGSIYAVLGIGALLLLGRLFISQMEGGSSGRSEEPAGVLFSPPPGYSIFELSEAAPAVAASELEEHALAPGAGKVGVHFRHAGNEVYWLADPAAGLLEERSAGPGGTRLQAIWRGSLRERFAWAKTNGTFETPGLTPGERANLYH